MERLETIGPASVDIVLDGIGRELVGAFGTETAAQFVNSAEQDDLPDSVEVDRKENYTRWHQVWQTATREVTVFDGNSWQVTTSFKDFDASVGFTDFKTVVSKDPSGNITVEGHLPVRIIQQYLFETAGGSIGRYQSLVLEALNNRFLSYTEANDTKHYSLRCKFVSGNPEASYVAFPLAD